MTGSALVSTIRPLTPEKLIVSGCGELKLASWIAARRVHTPPPTSQPPVPTFRSAWSPLLLTVNVCGAATAGVASSNSSALANMPTATSGFRPGLWCAWASVPIPRGGTYQQHGVLSNVCPAADGPLVVRARHLAVVEGLVEDLLLHPLFTSDLAKRPPRLVCLLDDLGRRVV